MRFSLPSATKSCAGKMASVEPENPISVNENQNASSSFRPVCDGRASPWPYLDEIFKFKCITQKNQ